MAYADWKPIAGAELVSNAPMAYPTVDATSPGTGTAVLQLRGMSYQTLVSLNANSQIECWFNLVAGSSQGAAYLTLRAQNDSFFGTRYRVVLGTNQPISGIQRVVSDTAVALSGVFPLTAPVSALWTKYRFSAVNSADLSAVYLRLEQWRDGAWLETLTAVDTGATRILTGGYARFGAAEIAGGQTATVNFDDVKAYNLT